MPVYYLSNEIIFPPPELAEDDTPLAVGGDLTIPRLLLAYSSGIFPWYSEELPILWWSPETRAIIDIASYRPSRSLQKTIRNKGFTVTFNQCFEQVIQHCAEIPRHGIVESWLLPEMQTAYTELHRLGYAHSVECWQDGTLAGGLYGVALGKVFCGESMFSRASNGSKIALTVLITELKELGYDFIDCQVQNDHLASLGSIEIERNDFLQRLVQAGVEASTNPCPGPFPHHPQITNSDNTSATESATTPSFCSDPASDQST